MALGVVKRHPPGNHLLGLEAVREFMQADGLVLEGAHHRRSMKMLPMHRLVLSMEMATPESLSIEVSSRLVN